MKLQNKTTISILIIVIAFILIISAEQIFLILPRFEKINLEKATDTVDEGLRVMGDELDNIAMIVSDYAIWDDTYNYTLTRDENFIANNFTDATMDNLNMALVGIYGKDGFLFSYDRLADSSQAAAIKNEVLARFDPEQHERTGFITVGDKTYMFSCEVISTTDESQHADFHIIFLRDYLETVNQKLAEIPGAKLEIIEFQGMTEAQQLHIERVFQNYLGQGANAATGRLVFGEPINARELVVYSFLTNLEGQRFAVIRSKTSANIIAEGQNSLHQTGVILVLFGITIAALTALFVRRFIIDPLNHLKIGLDTLIDPGAIPASGYNPGLQRRQDEIGELYQKFLYVSADIKAANAENKRINNQLETMVLDRTKALKAANAKLILYGESFEETSEGLLVTDPQGHIIMCNKAFSALSGCSRDELVGQKPQLVNPVTDQSDFYEALWDALKTRGSWEGELCYLHKNHTIKPIWLSFNAIRNEDKKITHYVGACSDLTGQKEMEDQLEQMAFYDGLTGLPNRSLFYIHLRKVVSRIKQDGGKMAVLFIDLDGFKLVNDTFGHSNGDQLLIEVGKRIGQHIRETDLLSRWGGDEFTVILDNIREKSDVKKIVSDLLYHISREIMIAGECISIGASVGIAIFPDAGDSIEQIMINADKAMYVSKSSGKNCYTFAKSPEQQLEIPKIVMINRLKRAIISNAFHLSYQPQIVVEAGRCQIFGAEALIRWTDEDGHTYMPDDFIALAEETGMINALGQWVINEACQAIREFMALGIAVPISINVSVTQFKSDDLVGTVKQAVKENRIDPQLLYMELTENIFVEDEKKTLTAIKALKELGIKIVLDDFGKGYSSLGLISQMPFDLIKVDKCFTQGIGLEKEKKLAAMIISIGEVLNLQTIVEGVETREQVDFHGQNGGRIYQGYYFSKPLEKTEFMDLCLGKWSLENMAGE
ncbi:EAL domain protein [anaerobic digester metagenome]